MTRIFAILALVLALAIGFVHGTAAGLVCATLAGAALMPINRMQLNAVGPLTLLDIAARNGQNIHALMEGVLTVAPELATFAAIPKNGISYSTLTCTELPSGDFRNPGEGTPLEKSKWDKQVGSMALFEALMRVPEDVLLNAMAETPNLVEGDILASEALRYMKGSANKIGSQTWYGQKISAKGFAGLSTQVDTVTNQVDAGGSAGADSSSVYLVYLEATPANPQGVHYVVGNGGKMSFSDEWGSQQAEVTTGKYAKVFTNNFLSYLGLVLPRKEAIYRAKNVVTGSPFTDALAATLKSKIPLALRNDKANWRWFMNTTALNLLHQSRITIGGAGGQSMQDEPTEVCGIPIIPTDSLVTTERAGLKP